MMLTFDAVDLGDGNPSVGLKADEMYRVQKVIRKAIEERVQMHGKKVIKGEFEIVLLIGQPKIGE